MRVGNNYSLAYDNCMKIYLVRHCLTNYNEKQLCNSDPSVDVHLTATGIAQAHRLADKLKDVNFDHIFVSELKRTRQTAEIINKSHNLNLEIDPRLNDIRSEFEGKPFADYAKALDAASNRWTVRFNGGESIEDIKVRSADFMNELKTKDCSCVLIVTSEWIIRAILALTQNLTNEEAWAIQIEQGGYRETEI